jgi:hypothetical protein
MKYHTVNLRDYPYQPIALKDFAKARNYFIENLPDKEYILFTSDHEEIPQMLHDYIRRLRPEHPYYRVRLLRFVNGRLESLFDPDYHPNLCSNRMRFIGVPEHPNCTGGMIDIPMLHNKTSYGHSYRVEELPLSYRKRFGNLRHRLWVVNRRIIRDELGQGLFRKGEERLY